MGVLGNLPLGVVSRLPPNPQHQSYHTTCTTHHAMHVFRDAWPPGCSTSLISLLAQAVWFIQKDVGPACQHKTEPSATHFFPQRAVIKPLSWQSFAVFLLLVQAPGMVRLPVGMLMPCQLSTSAVCQSSSPSLVYLAHRFRIYMRHLDFTCNQTACVVLPLIACCIGSVVAWRHGSGPGMLPCILHVCWDC